MKIRTPEEVRRQDEEARMNQRTPAVIYSKYKIQLACQSRGLWDRVKEAIAQAGLQDSWSNIQDISSENEELKRALPAIREKFGSDLVDKVLSESIAE